MKLEPYPFETAISKLRDELGGDLISTESALDRRDYLDLAEHITRSFVPCQADDGAIVDPYEPRRRDLEFFATARFAGALGQLIKVGRCLDLEGALIRAVECCLPLLHESALAPEFWAKELLYAWEALQDSLSPGRRQQWREAWIEHDPQRSYRCIVEGMHHNLTTFALMGEYLKYRHGFTDSLRFVEETIADQLSLELFSSTGLYVDPGAPMTYALVVNQQWDLLLHLGYDGAHASEIREISRRAGMTWLLMQSATGEAPFGGRSNQFNFIEGHLACLFETRARSSTQAGDVVLARAFRRAAMKALKSVRPWLSDMEPFRHLKHGFDPSLGHGVDSGGTYTVYGALAATLFATAYHLSDDAVQPGQCPADIGGYVIDLGPEFHKVFATCAGYHIEIETRAGRPRKDSTGLGRLHRRGVRPETAISSSIVSDPDYSIGTGLQSPMKSLALGPAWTSEDETEARLADMGMRIASVALAARRQSGDRLEFDVEYHGDFGTVTESYELSPEGLVYSVRGYNATPDARILIPLIVTDGDAGSSISAERSGFEVRYRGCIYRVWAEDGAGCELSGEGPLANRNGLYATGIVRCGCVRLELSQE